MINFIDETGKQHSAIVECKKTKGVNGEKSLTGTIYTNDEILEGIGRGWRLQFEDENYCLTYANPIDEGTRIVVEFDAVHEFFFDMSKSVVYAELNGSNTATAYLDFIFNGSGYEYRLEVTIPAFEKENFGMKNRLDLFKDFISSTGVEFSVNGKIVRILEKVGSNLSTIVKKGFNLNELKIEKDAGSFITYIKGFGAYKDPNDQSKGRLEVEYLSPLADIYGKLEGDPIIDERYTKADSLLARLKNEVESSYGISVDIDMEDLTKDGYEYDQPHEGDYIMAINKDLGFEQKVRIMSYTTSYDTEGSILEHEVSCGSDNIVKQSAKSESNFQKNVQAGLENAINTANQAWISADGKNTVFTGTDEPIATNKGDIWYQVDGEKTIMKFWNGYEWQEFIDPKAVQQAAQNAEAVANQASTNAQTALDNANNAVDKASQASQKADNSATMASDAKNQAATAINNANTALTNANKAINDVGDLKGVVTTNTASIEDLEDEVAIKADKSTVDAVTGRVSTAEGNITTMAGQINLKANQSTVDTITNRVSATEASFTLQDGKITTLTSKTDGNTTQISNLQSSYSGLSSTVSKATMDIDGITQADNLINGITFKNNSDLPDGVESVGNRTIPSDYIGIQGNTTYTFSRPVRIGNIGIRLYDVNKKYIGTPASTTPANLNTNFTTTNNAAYMKFVDESNSLKAGYRMKYAVPTLDSFSNLSQTVSSIQGTVADKVSQAQFTVLSNQVTTTVTNVSSLSDKFNQVNFANGVLPDARGNNITDVYFLNGILVVQNSSPDGYDSISWSNILEIGKTYTVVMRIKSGANQVDSVVMVGTPDGWSEQLSVSQDKMYTVSATFVAKNKNFYFRTQGKSFGKNTAIERIEIYEGLRSIDSSQITQLADRMNFRITNSDGSITQIDLANKVISLSGEQVNITGNTYISNGVIKTANIADLAVTNAKIGNISADKINVGTLNAANVNIINLNASNITSGTISGTNLSINLSTGVVNFQKGVIQKTDGSFKIDITNGSVESYQTTGGFTLNNGEISLRDSSIFNSNGITYGKIRWQLGSFTAQGMSLRGKEGWELSTMNFSKGIFSRSTGSGIYGSTDLGIYAQDIISLSGGSLTSNDIANSTPKILVGCNYNNISQVGADINIYGNWIQMTGLQGVIVKGNFSVTGSKNAIHKVGNDWIATPAYETAESYLGDIGSSQTNESGEVTINVEYLFSRIVNTNMEYQVFVSSYGEGHVWVDQRYPNVFVVKSSKPNTPFAWEIKAKRKGYEFDRLVKQAA